jgi:hypothetical protein
MFKIRMLPAGYGDCIWIEYGSESKPSRILIDAGTISTYKPLRSRITEDLGECATFELFIVSHIDTDHIDAAVKVLNSPSLPVQFEQIWFNGWNQLVDNDILGPQQGEYLSALAAKKGIPLNASFKGKAAFVPANGKLPVKKLPGGMKLTILSPGVQQLRSLRGKWRQMMGNAAGDAKTALKKLAVASKYKDALGAAKAPNIDSLADAVTDLDTSPPNGSSIAVLAEYEGKRCLLAADAHPYVLESSVDRLIASDGSSRLRLDAVKVQHHGSKYNVTTSFLKKLNCPRYLISTNGKIFKHPDPEGVARIIKYGGRNPSLYFNYDTERTAMWKSTRNGRGGYRWTATFRADTDPALDIDL